MSEHQKIKELESEFEARKQSLEKEIAELRNIETNLRDKLSITTTLLRTAREGLTQLAYPAEHIAAIESNGTGILVLSVTDFPRKAQTILDDMRRKEG